MAPFALNFLDDGAESILIASLDTGDFRAECRYWSPPTEFDDLKAALRTFPIAREHPLDMAWCDGCVSLRIEPIDSVGHLLASVALQDFSRDWNKCQSQFHTTYGDLDRFRSQLETVSIRGVGKAILSSS